MMMMRIEVTFHLSSYFQHNRAVRSTVAHARVAAGIQTQDRQLSNQHLGHLALMVLLPVVHPCPTNKGTGS